MFEIKNTEGFARTEIGPTWIVSTFDKETEGTAFLEVKKRSLQTDSNPRKCLLPWRL